MSVDRTSQAEAAAGALSLGDVERFLAAHHGTTVSDVELLRGGYWSAAYAYRAGGRELVLRVGQMLEGFEADRDAMAYNAPDLPVPEVLEIGEAFGAFYAISVRHHGRFLETVAEQDADVAGPTIVRLLAALKDAPPRDESAMTWRAWLMHAFVDDPEHPVSGWRAKLADDRELDALFRACEARVGELAESCPERRDLVHGDLLHSNVLVSDDASRVSAVFSWKCSTRGDFLYDVAWCTFWSAWHPGIEAADVYPRVVRSRWDGLAGAAERHHCYELQIGARHFGWNVWTGDDEGLRAVAARTAAILDRGPLAAG